MATFVRGQKMKMADLTSANTILVGLALEGIAQNTVDFSCFGVDAANQLSDDRYFVFYNQPASPEGAIQKMGSANGDMDRFQVDLSRLPQTVKKLVITATLDGGRNLSNITGGYLRIMAGGAEVARFPFKGSDFAQEKALIVGEIYWKDCWRFAAVGQGFNGGLSALLQHFGGEELKPPASAGNGAPKAAPATPAQPVPPPPPTISLKKVTLTKSGESQKVDLRKKSGEIEPIHINLNWDKQVRVRGGLFGSRTENADLDLGCMFEMADGSKSVIQALGNRFGSRTSPPYIMLDKDDRSGASADGENLFIFRPDLIRRVLIFAFIYEGAARFQDVNGRVLIKDDAGNEIFIPLNNPDPKQMFCAICLISQSGRSVTFTKEERYFPGHKECDNHYHFGFSWVAGSKD